MRAVAGASFDIATTHASNATFGIRSSAHDNNGLPVKKAWVARVASSLQRNGSRQRGMPVCGWQHRRKIGRKRVAQNQAHMGWTIERHARMLPRPDVVQLRMLMVGMVVVSDGGPSMGQQRQPHCTTWRQNYWNVCLIADDSRGGRRMLTPTA